MARTPVIIDVPFEVVEEEKKPKRTPVEMVIEHVATAEETVVIDEIEKALPTIDSKPHVDINPIIDGYRECARPDCSASFKPKSLSIIDTDATEYYCSSDCAIHEFYRKRHLGPVPEKIVSGASQASNRAHREEKKRKRAEAAPERDARYGPMRKVVEILGDTKTAKRVKLECGHTATARGDQQRCRQCRPGAEKKEKTPKKIRVEAAAVKETPMKRQPVTRADVKKSKRTPVKPAKRGKKGKSR